MSEQIKCDIAIIGGGAAGLSLAAGAAQMGASVVLIESGLMGGDCLNYGCVPSKSLLSAAKTYWHAKKSKALGVDGSDVHLNFAQVMQHVRDVIKTIAVHDSIERFESFGVRVIQAAGRFIDKQTIEAGDYRIKAKRVAVATGSKPFIPPISGIEEVPYLTNETLFDLIEQPEHLIVVGAGPIGCELAQAFAMLGSKVTVLEAFKSLPKDEADCVDIVKQSMAERGVVLLEPAEIKHVSIEGDFIAVNYSHDDKDSTVTGSHLLIATGRRANIHNLDLEKAGIDHSVRGIAVDKRLRSSNKKIYAMGDVATPYQFTHVAGYHAGIVLKNMLFRLPSKVDYRAVPWVTYTDPEIAHVGLLSEEADNQRIRYDIVEWPFSENDRAHAEGDTVGKIKILVGHKAKILGVTIVGQGAGEQLLPWVMAIREGKTLRSFTDVIAPYPTRSEISKRAASDFYTDAIFSNKVKTIVRWLLKLG